MLKRCSDKKDITEWNDWRQNHLGTSVVLQGGDLKGLHLKGANLIDAELQGTYLASAKLQKADFTRAKLQDTTFKYAYLQGANLVSTKLQGAKFNFAIVDGETFMGTRCEIDRETDFTDVALDDARINSGLKESLKYNIRRKNWITWSKQGSWIRRILKRPVRYLWWISDYGRSTTRIIKTFFAFSLGFAMIYWVWGLVCPPGVVQNLFEIDNGRTIPESIGCGMAALRSVYFSIVTMTTLGFGDMHARASSVAGYILLIVQVFFGYVLLGALITRLGILFMGEGPCAEFTPIEKPKNKK